MGTYYRIVENYIEDLDQGDIIEIGVDRGEGSTKFFVGLATQRNAKFLGIDAHPDQISGIIQKLSVDGKLPDNVEFVHAKGEQYLQSISDSGRSFSIAYLDNFDWNYWLEGPVESFVPAQQQMYENTMGVKMTNINSQLTHLVQAMHLIDLMTPRSVIICDDTWFEPREGIFIGKCSAAVPFLLSLGYEIKHHGGYRNRTGGSGVILRRG